WRLFQRIRPTHGRHRDHRLADDHRVPACAAVDHPLDYPYGAERLMPQSTLTVRTEAPIGRIHPRIYGHFAEHLGRCCYDGLWDGAGFRSDVVAALKKLPVPLLRWPGGCYADHYHWRDGIGPSRD